MECHGCRAVIEKSKRFCPTCGADTNIVPDAGNADEVTCDSCNAKVQKGKKFCADCGEGLIAD